MSTNPLRTPMACVLLALVLVSSVALARGRGREAAVGAPLRPTVEKLADGSELVLAPRPRAAWASLHYVVRTGSRKDPEGKEGLAHLLEHVIFHGTYDVRGEDFQQAVKTAGGEFNGFTTAHSTTYVLQAPAESFLPLADQLVRIVTSPKLDPRQMQREVEIIRTESQDLGQGPGFHEHLENSLFSGSGAILGTQQTLDSISRKDLADFYTRYYTPANTSIVITGGVKREEVLGMLERAVRLPPSLPGESPLTPVTPPVLPIEQSTRASFSLIAYGYHVAPKDKGACARVAALLELRLTRALHVEEPLTLGMQVRCMSLRGNTFLMALAFSESLNANTLPERMQLAFEQLGREPPTAAEEKLMDRHVQRAYAQQVEDDLQRGSELAREVAQPRAGPLDPALLMSLPKRLPRGAMRDFARRTFLPERQVVVNFSPFSG
ncbi:putative protease [Cystobacter fuscus DSM 2262]|uniref:Protease n=1 Tax=Cystobacter fuscus (strain ATCC 25194 / DSM 2262 / NBRC 100088 / M29) TaxID=1242864 RepID=S9QHF3_CYSF2|nr:pitrilysin family protein [Cystobacter fuscus]EPX60699.1 putative protease [Cystobacter fuscus DSM 2262]